MPLVVVPAISAQPHSALLQQIESQWNPFDLNRSQQSANRCERFTSTDRHKDGVTFHRVEVRLGGFSDAQAKLASCTTRSTITTYSYFVCSLKVGG
jgi:hypothetical protein